MTRALQILRAAARTVPRQRSPWFTERIWSDGDNNLVLSLRFYGLTGLNGPCAKWLTIARWGEWVEIHRSVARLILDAILASRIHEKWILPRVGCEESGT